MRLDLHHHGNDHGPALGALAEEPAQLLTEPLAGEGGVVALLFGARCYGPPARATRETTLGRPPGGRGGPRAARRGAHPRGRVGGGGGRGGRGGGAAARGWARRGGGGGVAPVVSGGGPEGGSSS